jgi:hypothetical protein
MELTGTATLGATSRVYQFSNLYPPIFTKVYMTCHWQVSSGHRVFAQLFRDARRFSQYETSSDHEHAKGGEG